MEPASLGRCQGSDQTVTLELRAGPRSHPQELLVSGGGGLGTRGCRDGGIGWNGKDSPQGVQNQRVAPRHRDLAVTETPRASLIVKIV